MTTNNPVTQAAHKSLHEDYKDSGRNADGLTLRELVEIALYTVQKINNYPKSFEKTVENYFLLLYPDEIKSYLMGRTINEKSIENSGLIQTEAGERRQSAMSTQAQQVRDIRNLCKLFVEQQESVLCLISDKLDELEAALSDSDVGKDGALNGE